MKWCERFRGLVGFHEVPRPIGLELLQVRPARIIGLDPKERQHKGVVVEGDGAIVVRRILYARPGVSCNF